MGWQDILGGALTGFSTGNPMAWKNSQLEQAYRQFQMQQGMEEMQMRKEMHELEGRKLDMILKQQERADKLSQTPAAGLLKIFGVDTTNMPEDTTVEQATAGSKVAIPFLEQQSKAADRKEKDKDRAEAREDRLTMFGITLADKKEARQQQEQLRRDTLAQNERHHQENLAVRKDLADMALGLRQRLPAQKVKEISDKKTEIEKYIKLSDEFVDKFGGDVIGGPTKTAAYEVLGMSKDRVNWWKRFKALDVVLRHELFGATLTGNEQKAWDAVTVNENTDPSIIKEQIKMRTTIARNALERDLDSYEQGGYGVQGLRGQGGMSGLDMNAIQSELAKRKGGK